MGLPNKYTVSLSLAALLPFFCFGYDVGFKMNAPIVRHDLNLTKPQLNKVLYVAQTRIFPAAMIVGIALNYAGRRSVIVTGLLFHFSSALLACVATSYGVLLAARILVAVSFAIGLTTGPIYVAEIAPADFRGGLISLSQLLLTVGTMLGYLFQYVAQTHLGNHISWRLVSGIGAVPSSLLLVGVVYFHSFVSLPESPCWLVVRGKIADACTLMERCGIHTEELQSRLNQLTHIAGIAPTDINEPVVQVNSVSVTVKPMWKKLFRRPSFDPHGTMVGVAVLNAIQSLSGADFAVWVEGMYIDHIKSSSPLRFFIADMVSSVVRMGASLVPILNVDLFGRRLLIFISIPVTLCAAGILGGVSIAGERGAIGVSTAHQYCLIMVILLQIGHALGLGAVPWVYAPESFDLWLRAPAVGVAVAANQFVDWMLQEKAIGLSFKIGNGGVFLVCSGIMAATLVSCFFFIRDENKLVLVDMVPPNGRQRRAPRQVIAQPSTRWRASTIRPIAF